MTTGAVGLRDVGRLNDISGAGDGRQIGDLARHSFELEVGNLSPDGRSSCLARQSCGAAGHCGVNGAGNWIGNALLSGRVLANLFLFFRTRGSLPGQNKPDSLPYP